MLPHKIPSDPYFKSEPVSRVGSSQRLNQLANPTSRSTTPQPYVVSSLNPVRNQLVNSRGTSSEADKEFERLPMVEQITNFEVQLQELSTKISTFKEDGLDAIVDKLIKINDDLKSKTSELEQHRELGRQIDQLETIGSNLDSRFKYILKELIACRSELQKLPKNPKKSTTIVNQFSTEDVLKYAMKLAKFTKAPPTIAQPYQIHPNNYIWPAEDALRRGMLAQCSLTPDEILKAELNTGNEQEILSPVKNIEKNFNQEPQKERKGSFGDYGNNENKESKNDDQGIDLDLFDPDDEFSD